MKNLKGKVVSCSMNKTIIVEVPYLRLHPLYKKYLKRSKRYKVHCERNDIKLGMEVNIVETKPISKDKHYKVI